MLKFLFCLFFLLFFSTPCKVPGSALAEAVDRRWCWLAGRQLNSRYRRAAKSFFLFPKCDCFCQAWYQRNTTTTKMFVLCCWSHDHDATRQSLGPVGVLSKFHTGGRTVRPCAPPEPNGQSHVFFCPLFKEIGRRLGLAALPLQEMAVLSSSP